MLTGCSRNILEGEYAWNTHQAELESRWNSCEFSRLGCTKSGCNFIRTAVRVAGRTIHASYGYYPTRGSKGARGCESDMLAARHYTMLNSSGGWDSGWIYHPYSHGCRDKPYGYEALRRSALVDCTRLKKFLLPVVCRCHDRCGAFDPVKRCVNYSINIRIHYGLWQDGSSADSVIGWAWIAFKIMIFTAIPGRTRMRYCPYIEKNYNAIKGVYCRVRLVWTSCRFLSAVRFVYKMPRNLSRFSLRGQSAYPQPRSPYNPR